MHLFAASDTDPVIALFRWLVVAVVAFPFVAAVVAAVSGRRARRVALVLALVQVGITAGVVLGTLEAVDQRGAEQPGDAPRFKPLFVPGELPSTYRDTAWTLAGLTAAPAGSSVHLYLGVDGLNIWLAALCAVMMLPAVLVSWDAVTDRPAGFYAWLFVLQGGVVGAFLSFDVILFYVFFELTLIPTFFLIGRWGTGSARRDAARKFFLYTLAGSLLTLVGLVGVALAYPTPVDPVSGTTLADAVVEVQAADPAAPGGKASEFRLAARGPVTFALPRLMANVHVWSESWRSAQRLVLSTEQGVEDIRKGKDRAALREAEQRAAAAKAFLPTARQAHLEAGDLQFWLFLALIAGFLVKVPVWPFHTWMPAAYSEAPLGATLFLSAVLAKLGTFGILRLVLPLTPDAAIQYGLPAVGTLAAFGIVYGSFCAFGQRDIRLLVAYSSLAHLGFLVLGLFAFNAEGLSGAALHMVNHGVSIGALFALLSFFLARYRTTDMRPFGGLMGRFPALAFLTFVLVLASIGLPGLNNFVSEMLMLGGLVRDAEPGSGVTRPRAIALAAVATFSIFLSAWYMLTMMQRVFFNPLREPPAGPEPPRDVTGREAWTLGTLAVLCLALGIFPQVLLDSMKADVGVLARVGDAARVRVRAEPPELPALPPVSTVDPNAPKKGGPPGGGKGGPPGGEKGGGKGKGGGKKGGAAPPPEE